MLLELELKNFKTHENTKINFSNGVNILTGVMGSGKSSILQAIVFALYGELPEIRSKKMSVSDLIMRKPSRKSYAEIKLKFRLGTDIYTVYRKISNNPDAKLFINDKLYEVGSRKVTQKISEILGLSYDQFVNVIHVRQNEIDNFLRMSKRDRVSIIDEILGITKVEDLKSNLRVIKRSAENNLKFLEPYLSKDVELLKAKIKKLEEDLKENQDKFNKLSEKRSNLYAQYKELKEKLEILVNLKEKLEKLNKEKLRLNSIIEKLNNEIKFLPKIDNIEEKYNEILKKREELKLKRDKLLAEISKLRSKLKEIEEIKPKIEELEKFVNLEVIDYSEEIENKRNDLMQIKAEISNHKKALDELKKAGSKCPVCGSPLKNKEEHIKKHEKIIKDLENKYFILFKELNDLKKKQEEEERKSRKILMAKERYKIYLDKIQDENTLREELERFEKEYQLLDNELKDIENKLEEYMSALERSRKEKELEEYKKKLEKLEHESSSILYDEDLHLKLEETFENVKAELISVNKELELLPKVIESTKLNLEQIQKEFNEVEENKRKYMKIKKALENLNILLNSLADVQILIRNTFVEAVNTLLQDIWPMLYPYKDYTALRLRIISEGIKAGDYILELKDSSGFVPVVSTASGGEQTIASLALRIAFSKLLSNLNIILLDEPTHNLDEQGIEKLQELLRQGGDLLDQIILITHERRIEKAATGRVYHLHRDKERDLPTVIEEVS